MSVTDAREQATAASRPARSVTVLVSAVVIAAFGIGMIQGGTRTFFGTNRVHVTSPAPLAMVTVPFAIKWDTAGQRPSQYAVFVDLQPIAPGHTLHDLASQQCKRARGCQPTDGYLEGLGVFRSANGSVNVGYLKPLAGAASRAPHPVHTATIVAMDRAGRRVGDLAWQVQFRG